MSKIITISLILSAVVVLAFIMAGVAFPETITQTDIPAETIVRGSS